MVAPMKRRLFLSLLAGLLIWISIYLMAIAHQSSHAGSLVATIEIVLSLGLAIVACFLLRLP